MNPTPWARFTDSSNPVPTADMAATVVPVEAWTDLSPPQPRLFHHRGDGTFTLDGPTVDLKDRMTKWQYVM
ncbi:hypothetical protein OOK29_19240 [Streptomyces phaeochromogenes]|uniref:hypothetical protein n=1 Tax=Streptomyces phaeochromogenes TaxID=1923 RepID=UPI00225120B1|nr:hypothetical protein [Streptomyces phaeochromogenes]MCX5600278.1 hypothetical protein [Streptomyces phaeochromogenes]WSJ09442.1 hypothetical protein OG437_40330 [Streptomyces phaeochromogenes]